MSGNWPDLGLVRLDSGQLRSNGARSCSRALAAFLIAPQGCRYPARFFPAQFYMITRRCTQRQFLLRPDPATNTAFTYCLIEAALRCQIDVLPPCALSNHYHAVIFDRCGRYPEFVEYFDKMFARSQNALRGVERTSGHPSRATW